MQPGVLNADFISGCQRRQKALNHLQLIVIPGFDCHQDNNSSMKPLKYKSTLMVSAILDILRKHITAKCLE